MGARRSLRAAPVDVALAFCAARSLVAQQPPVLVARTVWNGVYTEEQAKRGLVAYDAHCASCHQPDLSGYRSILKGARFLSEYREASVYRLFDKIRSTMPRGAAGSLSDETYANIVAYLLQANGFPAGAPGDDELTVDRMAAIRVTGRNGPEPAPNFSLVQVVGCLARRDADGAATLWMLTSASEPVRVSQPQPSPDEPLAAGTPSGGGTFELMVSPAFNPGSDAGRRVEARGFLIRRAAGDRLNVTSLQPLNSECQP